MQQGDGFHEGVDIPELLQRRIAKSQRSSGGAARDVEDRKPIETGGFEG